MSVQRFGKVWPQPERSIRSKMATNRDNKIISSTTIGLLYLLKIKEIAQASRSLLFGSKQQLRRVLRKDYFGSKFVLRNVNKRYDDVTASR